MERCDKCGYQLKDVLGLSYLTYVRTQRKKVTSSIKMVSGTFKEIGSFRVIENDNFHVLVCGNAEDSYKLAIDYFNFTRKANEKKRIFVSAKWVECEKSSMREE